MLVISKTMKENEFLKRLIRKSKEIPKPLKEINNLSTE